MRVCVFCASSLGTNPRLADAAQELGRALAASGHGLVYGGADVGLMKVLADAALEAGGEVIGVIPKALEAREIAHTGLTRLEVVGSMHERKARMAELADGFVALPGGFGTWDELCEILTWRQLGIHSKPVALVNVDGFYDALVELARGAVGMGILKEAHAGLLATFRTVDEALGYLERGGEAMPEKWG